MQQTIAQLNSLLAQGSTSSSQLTQQSLQQIEKQNPQLNAFISVDQQGALAQAEACDKKGFSPEDSPLRGIPVALKDLFMQVNTPTTCASRILKGFISPYDATVVSRLKRAGAVIVGKTNMDEFAMGSTTRHSDYGACIHPFDLKITPGGSSGGSAVAVASGMVPIAIGTDTGGSVRQPASLCGIVGIKPSYGRISRYGMVAYASSLDQCGIFATTAADCAATLEVLAGHDPLDATSSDMPVDSYSAKPANCKGLRIGVAGEFLSKDLHPQLHRAFEFCLNQYKKLGAEIVDISIPHFKQAIASYYVTAAAEASSNLGRYDGVRYGHRAENINSLNELYVRSRSEGFGDEVQRRIMLGVFVLSSGYYDAYYLKAQKIRRLLANDFARAFIQADCILAPVIPNPKLSADLGVGDQTSEYLADLYTVPVNMAGLPAVSFPTYYVSQPEKSFGVGCQLIGPHWSEAKLLSTISSYERLLAS